MANSNIRVLRKVCWCSGKKLRKKKFRKRLTRKEKEIEKGVKPSNHGKIFKNFTEEELRRL